MENFADQCLDMAQSILGHNLESISEQGTISPVAGESSRLDEPGHAALAIGEYYRATNETRSATTIWSTLRPQRTQAFPKKTLKRLGLHGARPALFRPGQDRNPVWERLLDPTREQLDKRLLENFENYWASTSQSGHPLQPGSFQKDETGRLVTVSWAHRIGKSSAATLMMRRGLANWGAFDVYGVMSFVFSRQALQLHANLRASGCLPAHPRGKVSQLIPDLAAGRVRLPGPLHWCLRPDALHQPALQALRDGWILKSSATSTPMPCATYS